uniref:Putative ovule protein n=1 Tax=Solanum chacoense TaxID=4108 RepID=A0A0V0GHC1_SOLCH
MLRKDVRLSICTNNMRVQSQLIIDNPLQFMLTTTHLMITTSLLNINGSEITLWRCIQRKVSVKMTITIGVPTWLKQQN